MSQSLYLSCGARTVISVAAEEMRRDLLHARSPSPKIYKSTENALVFVMLY